MGHVGREVVFGGWAGALKPLGALRRASVPYLSEPCVLHCSPCPSHEIKQNNTLQNAETMKEGSRVPMRFQKELENHSPGPLHHPHLSRCVFLPWLCHHTLLPSVHASLVLHVAGRVSFINTGLKASGACQGLSDLAGTCQGT